MTSPSMRDIALRAGVSVSTVSRAMSGGNVKEETWFRIVQTAEALGYEARQSGSSAGRRALSELTVGFVTTDLANYYSFGAITEAASVVQDAGARVDLTNLSEDLADVAARLRASAEACDALVLFSPRLSDQTIRRYCDPSRTVVTNRLIDGYSSVVLDESSGMSQVMRHLAALGHRTVLYASGPDTAWGNRRRRQQFEALAPEFGLQAKVVGPFQASLSGGVIAGDSVMSEADATAVIAFNDLLASGIVSRLLERGVRIPEDVSIVGADNSILAEVSRPQLTSVTTVQSRVGKTAAQLVLRLLLGESDRAEKQIVLEEDLVVRGSTGLASAE